MLKITAKLKIALKSLLDVKLGKIATDKAELIFDGDEIAVGMEVFVEAETEDGVAPAEDGEYTLEDGRIIVIAEGKVAEIKEVEEPAEPEAEPEVEMAEEEAPAPADEPEPEESNEEEATEDDRIAALEGKVVALTDALNGIVNSLAALEGRIQDLEGKLAKVEEPAADPVDDTPAPEEMHKTKMSYLRK